MDKSWEELCEVLTLSSSGIASLDHESKEDDVKERGTDTSSSGCSSEAGDNHVNHSDFDDIAADSGAFTEEDDEVEVKTKGNDIPHSSDCFCHRLRSWLGRRASRSWKITQDPFYQDNLDTLWSQNESIQNFAMCNYDPYPEIQSETFRYSGSRDRLGRPHGKGRIYFPNGRSFNGHFERGLRSGTGELLEREGVRILRGHYLNDQLQGICEVGTNEGGFMEITFDRGVAHGPARRFGPDGHLQWIGRYRHGLPFGPRWRSLDGHGWHFGTVNATGRMSGEHIVYLYPDLHSALCGKWSKDVMRSAKLFKVCDIVETDGMPVPVLSDKPISNVSYSADVSGYSVISRFPMLQDPYEYSLVHVQRSTLPGGGEGLFAKRPIQAGTVIAFYNGIRFHDCHAFNDWDHNSYKIRLNEKRKQILDIPPDCRDLSKYCATLAHKINHSFSPNAKFCDFFHPRFGRILCVKTSKVVKANEEIYCNYGYNLADCPQWYKDLHDRLFFDPLSYIASKSKRK